MNIREVRPGDVPSVAAIYAHHVANGSGTFEEVAPTEVEMARRVDGVQSLGLPWRVAEADGEIVGYAYASSFRPRPGYRFTAEDSVYVSPGGMRKGVGRALLGDVVARCEALGLRQLLAVIGDSGNAPSIGLHKALGFDLIGVARDVGFKHGRWVDVVWMQRSLGAGAAMAPVGDGLSLGER